MNKPLATIIVILVIVGGVYLTFRNKAEAPTNTVNQTPPLNSGENPQPGSQVHDLPVEPAAAKAREDLALKLGVETKTIVIMQITDMTWSDSCLGLGGPAESCLQALTPGFQVEMVSQGKTYIYRTDKTGEVVRAEI